MVNIYQTNNIKKTKDNSNHSLKEFPTGIAILLHFITLGLFTWIYYGMQHSKLPKLTKNDPGAAKAILFMLIPIWNIYWHFFTYLRLIDRLNLQLKFKNKNYIDREACLIFLIVGIIPYVGIIFFLILQPIMVYWLQNSINELAK